MKNFNTLNNPVKIVLATALFLIFSLLPFVQVSAETVVRNADSVTIAVDQEVLSDAYFAGKTAVISGSVEGDMNVAAATVTHNGNIKSDLMVLAARAQILGTVGDDVRVLAGDTEIGGEIEGDVFVISGTLHVLSTAKIKGDIYFFGNSAVLEGEVAGSVMGTYTTLRINGLVEGSVDVKVADKLTVGERGKVNGDIQYTSNNDLVRATSAVIEGKVVKGSVAPESSDTFPYRSMAIAFMIALFSALTVYLFTRHQLPQFIRKECAPYALRSLVGLLLFITLPFIGVLLMVTVLGFWLGLFVLSIWLLLLVISYVVAPILLGSLLWRMAGGNIVVNTLTVCTGTVVLFLSMMISFVGVAATFILMCIIAGALATAVYRLVR